MIKDTFQIKDLENFTGIKIPTIRIWEKRYNILKPERTDTGIRLYSVKDIAKLLNVLYLYNNGWKISKIALLSDKELHTIVNNISAKKDIYPIEVEEFIITMLEFDTNKFNTVYTKLRNTFSFEIVYEKYFYPLLLKIGILWQTDTIDVIHEHFISSLILQKIIYEIEADQTPPTASSKTYILFLPENEMHEIGLRYLQYRLMKFRKKTIYLGNHVGLEHLIRFKNRKDVVLIANLTIAPNQKSLQNYLDTITDFSKSTNLPVHIYGLQFNMHGVVKKSFRKVCIYKTGKELLNAILN